MRRSYKDWTLEDFVEEARKTGATSRKDLEKLDGGLNFGIRKRGLLDDVAEALEWERLCRDYSSFTLEDFVEEVRKTGATARSDLKKLDRKLYEAACARNILDDVAEALEWKYRHFDRSALLWCVYQYTEYSFVYTGITKDMECRDSQHCINGKSLVYVHMDDPELTVLHEDLTMQEAEYLEKAEIEATVDAGLFVLNKIHNPQWLGTRFSWEKEKTH